MWKINLLLLVTVVCVGPVVGEELWDQWWNYGSGISGPSSWGGFNPSWRFCSLGKLQSPIDIIPSELLFDSNLRHITVSHHKVPATLMNTGHDLTIQLHHGRQQVMLTDGPLSYEYAADKMVIHFGSYDGRGSEHTIDGKAFPAEIQIYGYNTKLYSNMSQAELNHAGTVAISLLISANDTQKQSEPLNHILSSVNSVQYKDTSAKLTAFSVKGLLPTTQNYVTYDGSLTQPGCHETVTWIVMNKPLYITTEQISVLRQTLRTSESSGSKLKMENNYRPVQSVSRRAVRTNINFPTQKAATCDIQREKSYTANLSGLPSIFTPLI